MRRWRHSRWTNPRDLDDETLRRIAEQGHPHAPREWEDDCFAE